MPELWRSGAGNPNANSKVESHRAGRRDGADDFSGLRRLPNAKEADAKFTNPAARVHAMKKNITARWTPRLKKLKAIPIRQPWAWLIVNCYKEIWSANRRWCALKQAMMQEILTGRAQLV
jgi:hypothetical protein